ncbi:hypothetical protein EHQ52_15370 [Leptospira koniambonensis]|uniref:Lipoprotein n=1 Tax=Leptospira koniambonensis TaxID=2484950 RepID=A0A4R9J349_9LEPT|nr:hypothetical protein [Leptospira koniambonensis]TGL31316.1 hypothetical protein EHQ52_15370 [Leptospira koniambonensis]
MRKVVFIILISFLFSCDGILRIENNVFIKNKIDSKLYLSKFTGECDIYFNLLEIKGVAFTPNPEKIIYRDKVFVKDGVLEYQTITWGKESKYKVHLKCPNYKEVVREFDFPAIEPAYYYFELEK